MLRDGLHAFCRYIPILSVIGPETLVKVRLYRGNIDAQVPRAVFLSSQTLLVSQT